MIILGSSALHGPTVGLSVGGWPGAKPYRAVVASGARNLHLGHIRVSAGASGRRCVSPGARSLGAISMLPLDRRVAIGNRGASE